VELHSLLANEQGLDCIPEQEEDEEVAEYEDSDRNGELTPGLISARPSSSSSKRGTKKLKLKKEVGLFGSISFVVGVMIGAGIYSSPSHENMFKKAGSTGMSLIVWAGSGVIAILSSLCYAELGTTITMSGGERTYLSKIFGGLAGFLYSWTATLILKPCGLAAVAISFGEYAAVLFFPECRLDFAGLQSLAKILAAFAIGVICFINCASVKWATRIQVVFTAAKLAAIALLIITGLVRLGQGYDQNFTNAFEGTTTKISDIGFAFYGGLWAYDGWNNLNYVTEELKNPLRDLPLAIMIGIPLVTGCYVLVNIAYLTVLTQAEIASSGAVAVTLANQLYGVMAWVMPVFVACSTFGAANGSAFTGGRLVYVSAREGHMPKMLALIHRKRHTPLPAMVFTCFIAWIMLIPDSSNFETLIKYFSFAAWTFYGATIAALLWLRFRKPLIERPYKVFIGIPVIVLLASIYLVIAPFYDYPLESFFCLLFIILGIPMYFVFVKFDILPKGFLEFIDKITYKLEALTDCAYPEREVDN